MRGAHKRLDNATRVTQLSEFARSPIIADIILTGKRGMRGVARAMEQPVLAMRETTEGTKIEVAGDIIGRARLAIVRDAGRFLSDASAGTLVARLPDPFGNGQDNRSIVEIIGNG